MIRRLLSAVAAAALHRHDHRLLPRPRGTADTEARLRPLPPPHTHPEHPPVRCRTARRPPPPAEASDQVIGTVVRFTSDRTSIDVTIGEDSPAVRDFLSMLPLQVPFEELAGREKIAYLPRELNVAGSPGSDPEDGDLIYYTPWGNLGFYYNAAGIGYSDADAAHRHLQRHRRAARPSSKAATSPSRSSADRRRTENPVTTTAVIGAGPGLGAAIARRFGAEGHDIALIARHQGRLHALADQHRREPASPPAGTPPTRPRPREPAPWPLGSGDPGARAHRGAPYLRPSLNEPTHHAVPIVGDAEAWYALQSHPGVRHFLSWPERTRRESKAHFRGRTRRTRLNHVDDFLALAVTRDAELIGDNSLHLRAVAPPVRTVEIGWLIHPRFEGRGYAAEPQSRYSSTCSTSST